MPFVDIIDRSHGVSEPDEHGNRFLHNESIVRLERAVMAAETSRKAGGVLPAVNGYNLPPLATGLDVLKMGKEAWQEMLNAATWTWLSDSGAAINLDHPDVKAVF